MAPATQTRRASKPAPKRTAGARTSAAPVRASRDLIEFVADAAGAPKLKIDRDAGVIYGVKVLGRFSRNNHGLKEAVNGTEYTPDAMRTALPLYEGATVYGDHPDRQNLAGATREIESTFGVLKNVRVESENGEECVRADLHYYTSHPMADRVIEDVERGIGRFGLSHNAGAARERFDRDSQRLVIEEIGVVRSVDLVNRPATNRNLWESEAVSNAAQQPKKITVRSLLESQRKRFSQRRLGWLKFLLEDDYAPPMDAEMAEPEAGAEPDDALWGGFTAAIGAILDKYKGGELDAGGAVKEIGKYIKAHDKLTGEDEPEEVEESEEDDEMGKKKDDEGKSDEEKTESLKADLAALKRKDAVRDLCESEGVKLTPAQLKAACLLESEADRKQFVADLKAAPKPAGKPTRSTPPGGNPNPPARQLAESDAWDAEADLNMLRGAH